MPGNKLRTRVPAIRTFAQPIIQSTLYYLPVLLATDSWTSVPACGWRSLPLSPQGRGSQSLEPMAQLCASLEPPGHRFKDLIVARKLRSTLLTSLTTEAEPWVEPIETEQFQLNRHIECPALANYHWSH